MKLANRWHFTDPQLTDFVRSILNLVNGNITESNLGLTATSTDKYVIGWAHVFGETPIPAVDGSTKAFQLALPYTRKTLRVRLMGVDQVRDDDYTETGDTTFEMVTAPASDMKLRVDYIKRSATAGSGDVEDVIIPPQPDPDPIADYVKLLLHCNGDDESQTFIDSSVSNTKTMTASGTAQIDTAQKKFGIASGLFDGNSDYVSTPDHADWGVFASATDNWTVDLWIKQQDFGRDQTYVAQYQNLSNYWELTVGTDNLTAVRFLTPALRGVYCDGGSTQIDSNWHHLALCKVGNKYGWYVDGIQRGYLQTSSTTNIEGLLYAGARREGDKYFGGHIDELQIAHSNIFSAAPNSGKTDTITVPTGEYGT